MPTAAASRCGNGESHYWLVAGLGGGDQTVLRRIAPHFEVGRLVEPLPPNGAGPSGKLSHLGVPGSAPRALRRSPTSGIWPKAPTWAAQRTGLRRSSLAASWSECGSRGTTGRICRLPKKKTKDDPAQQSKAFIEKARELGADDDVAAEDEVMRRLAQQKRRDARAKPKSPLTRRG